MKPWQALLLAPFVGTLACLLFYYLMKYFPIILGVVVVSFIGIILLAPFAKEEGN